MTCIVGYIDRENHKIIIGGDSAGISGLSLSHRKDPKVFIREPFIMGFTSSFRMGQLLMCDDRFSIRIQKPDESDYAYMISAFIPSIQKLFSDGGYLKENNNVKSGGTFIVGYKNNLYMIENDFQIAEYNEDYCVCGCGEDFALGSLFTSTGSAKERIETALKAAEYNSTGVSSPFKILELEY